MLKQIEPKKIYIRVQAQPITTAGIYHNSDLGLISLSSDGSNWITIADKNLGATQVYNAGDTLSEANCGKYYQWGNNYGFPFTGSVTTSSTQVNASTYGPGNYYSSSTFIVGNANWDNSGSLNLWGDTTNTNVARRGPCDEGFHIQTEAEFTTLINIGVSLGVWSGSNASGMKTYIKMPFAGYRSYTNGTITNQGNYIFLWSSSNGTADYYAVVCFGSTTSLTAYSDMKAQGFPIRPFKNEAVQPDDSRTKLY